MKYVPVAIACYTDTANTYAEFSLTWSKCGPFLVSEEPLAKGSRWGQEGSWLRPDSRDGQECRVFFAEVAVCFGGMFCWWGSWPSERRRPPDPGMSCNRPSLLRSWTWKNDGQPGRGGYRYRADRDIGEVEVIPVAAASSQEFEWHQGVDWKSLGRGWRRSPCSIVLRWCRITASAVGGSLCGLILPLASNWTSLFFIGLLSHICFSRPVRTGWMGNNWLLLIFHSSSSRFVVKECQGRLNQKSAWSGSRRLLVFVFVTCPTGRCQLVVSWN